MYKQVAVAIGILVVLCFCVAAFDSGPSNNLAVEVTPMRIRGFCMAGQSRKTITLLTEPRQWSIGPGSVLPEGIYFVHHSDTEVTIGVDAGTGVYRGKVEVVLSNAVPLENWTGPIMTLTATVDLEIHVVERSQSAINFLTGSQDIVILPYP